MNMKLLNFKIKKLWYAVSTSSFALTWLTVSSVVQASDLQIYAKPEGGQTTVILMLDNSMSMTMNSDGLGQHRLARLKAGVQDLLTRDTVTLNNGTTVNLADAYVGLGYFSDSSSNKHGIIKVPAAPLDAASTRNTTGSQRKKLWDAVTAMDGNSYTPSANAMAEAAAYLLGTTTYWEKEIQEQRTVKKEQYKLVRKYNQTSSQSCGFFCTQYKYTYTYEYYNCRLHNTTNFTNNTQTCGEWEKDNTKSTLWSDSTWRTSPGWGGQPTIPSHDSSTTNPNNIGNNTNQTIIYSVNTQQTYTRITNANTSSKTSGIVDAKSNSLLVESTTASNLNLRYKSPLPENSVSCDGQGIYFLSDGLPNQSTTDSTWPLMQAALEDDTFECAVDVAAQSNNSNLPNPNGDSNIDKAGWHCMGALAKLLYSGDNPKRRSINTAFVGFGNAFSDPASGGAKYACQLGSKLTGDTCSPDATNSDLKNPGEGFGNGGFYYVTSTNEITQSIASFIKDNQNGVVAPLATGQITVPYDALNPNMLQNYGYLRALEPNPASNHVTWRGNLKKYEVVQSGTTAGAFQGDSGGLVFNNLGKFRTGTKDFWNSSNYSDGGTTWLGGTYSKVPLPILGQTQTVDATGKVTRYAYNASNNIRNIFTDISAATSTALTKQSTKDSPLLRIPAAPDGTNPFTSPTGTANYILGNLSSMKST